MTTVKDEIITEFKRFCLYYPAMSRYYSIKFQFQRDVWEVFTTFGLIRIENNGKLCEIILFPVFNPLIIKESARFEITKEQYEELKALYFGGIKPDYEYLKKWYGYDGNR